MNLKHGDEKHRCHESGTPAECGHSQSLDASDGDADRREPENADRPGSPVDGFGVAAIRRGAVLLSGGQPGSVGRRGSERRLLARDRPSAPKLYTDLTCVVDWAKVPSYLG